ncbi:hypothetical protein BJ546DRAFT_514957 [Cryomyces antarcticus]
MCPRNHTETKPAVDVLEILGDTRRYLEILGVVVVQSNRTSSGFETGSCRETTTPKLHSTGSSSIAQFFDSKSIFLAHSSSLGSIKCRPFRDHNSQCGCSSSSPSFHHIGVSDTTSSSVSQPSSPMTTQDTSPWPLVLSNVSRLTAQNDWLWPHAMPGPDPSRPPALCLNLPHLRRVSLHLAGSTRSPTPSKELDSGFSGCGVHEPRRACILQRTQARTHPTSHKVYIHFLSAHPIPSYPTPRLFGVEALPLERLVRACASHLA